MMHLLPLAALALAVSLDGFGVGAMYGLRGIKIPVVSVTIIAAMSGAVFFLSMLLGVAAAAFLSPGLTKTAGAVILIGIGCWAVLQMILGRSEQENHEQQNHDQQAQPLQPGSQAQQAQPQSRVLSIELKRLGLVIQILKTPSAADMDRSGVISAAEAAWLGLALSLDAFGAGIGAAFVGYAPLLTSVFIAGSCGLFIYAGLRTGLFYSNVKWLRKLSVVPGCMLILMGLMKLM